MKNVMKKTTVFTTPLLVMLFALSNFYVTAQKAPPEFSVYAAGGISTYCFQPTTKGVSFAPFTLETIKTNIPGYKVNSSMGYSSDFGFGFTGFFSRQVGIHTSVGFGLLNVKSKVNLYSITENYKDEFNEVYHRHAKLINYTEIYKPMYVCIPVMLQFQTKQKQYWNWTRSQRAGFYAMGGVKLHILFNNKYETSVDSLYTAAYFPEKENWQGTQTFVGLGGFNGNGTTGKSDVGVLINLALETGVKWRIDNNIYVYTGVFFDCGLYDQINSDKEGNRQAYEKFTTKDDFNDLTLLKFSKRANLMVVGVKVRFAFTKNQRPF